MPKFSKKSKAQLETCHPLLQKLFNEVIKVYDCTIVQGYRGEEEQNKAYAQGKSKLKYPKSKHNKSPSMAVDVAPYVGGKLSWDTNQVIHFAGVVIGIAYMLKISLRWGGDWDLDNYLANNTFNDLVHFELNI